LLKTISCNAKYGAGGLGQHLALVIEEARAQGELDCYFTARPAQDDPAGRTVELPYLPATLRYTPVRFSPGWRSYVSFDFFDKAVAGRLGPGQSFHAFAGQELRAFRRARRLGYEVLQLEACNSHVRNVQTQHAKAIRQHGIEGRWLNEALARKTIQGYDEADIIYANSDYTRQSLIDRGIPASKVRHRRLIPDPRFRPAAEKPSDGVFRVVYVGSVTVPKGVPVLIEAFSRLKEPNAELTLVGGPTTRRMQEYVARWQAKDPRIRLAPGDPLPHYQRADVCVHPTYEDGLPIPRQRRWPAEFL
jgi:Glycosyltransferase